MDKETQVLEMAKILCPKGTANCEKCSKNYKCDVKFSQLAKLFDGGCLIVGDDEIVIKKREYDILLKDYALTYDNAYQWGLKVGEEKTAIEILQELKNKLVKPHSFGDERVMIELLAEELGIELE